MYVPDHFSPADADSFSFISQFSFGELISAVEGKSFCTHLPFLFDDKNIFLLCHIAKANPQWREIGGQEVLAVFHGPHGYISPSWYDKAGVPTWNYQVVHVYGKASVFEDKERMSDMVENLSAAHEAGSENPWNGEYQARMLDAIIGIEIEITEVQAKHKLSQNRTDNERKNIIAELQGLGNTILADAMIDALKEKG
ncbi:MAG: FMN-binding negative transcriptional regulator [Gammaproteobacteria bacterium]|nr:FMN-binding negative transcriptional regulator [Gammaproteobacteria bacterium]MDD9896525.1 FMN-binding negative transcriptional regulator [Gammaproteobacteria bacterium]MDD9958720.1 FMN-binding negative transcriptional regulator [Gammaproteobacteria bacterium]